MSKKSGNDYVRLEEIPKKLKRWRKKVTQTLPKKYVFEFNNLPEEKDRQGTLQNYFLDLHKHSLEILAKAARGE